MGCRQSRCVEAGGIEMVGMPAPPAPIRKLQLMELPNDMLVHIACWCTIADVARLRACCKEMRSVVDADRVLSEHLSLQRFFACVRKINPLRYEQGLTGARNMRSRV